MTAIGLGASYIPLQAFAAAGDGSGDAEGTTGSLSKWTNRIIGFIPGDVVGLYLVVTGFITVPVKSYTGYWAAFAVGVVLSPILVWYNAWKAFKKQYRRRPAKGELSLPWFRMIAAVAAFVTWVYVLPGSPFENVSTPQVWARPLALAAVTILLAVGDEVFTADEPVNAP
jgi:membrane protease YdiL (CAAX protease family)